GLPSNAARRSRTSRFPWRASSRRWSPLLLRRQLLRRVRLERDLRVVREKIAPQEPVVAAGGLAIRRVETVLLHQLPPRGRAGAEPVDLHAAGLHGLELFLERLVDRLRARAEDADVRKHSRIVVRRGERVPTAHRQSRDRAIVFGREHAEALLDERNHVLDEALGIRACVRLRRAPAATALPPCGGLRGLNRRRVPRLHCLPPP